MFFSTKKGSYALLFIALLCILCLIAVNSGLLRHYNITNKIKAGQDGFKQKINRINKEMAIDDSGAMEETNIKLFNPDESIITYYIDGTDVSFTKTQINKSRTESGYWTNGFPLKPQEAILRYGHLLPPWERHEILNYPKVYFLGLGANKTQLTQNMSTNFGFDHDNEKYVEITGQYTVVVGDHIGYRYEIIKFLGSGAYGSVVLARDWSNPTARNVAIKIMHIPSDRKVFIREIKMMEHIKNYSSNLDYFSRMIASFKFRNHVCIVFDLLGDSVSGKHLKYPVKKH